MVDTEILLNGYVQEVPLTNGLIATVHAPVKATSWREPEPAGPLRCGRMEISGGESAP